MSSVLVVTIISSCMVATLLYVLSASLQFFGVKPSR